MRRLSLGVAASWVAVLILAWVWSLGMDLDPSAATARPWAGPTSDHPLGTDQLGRDQWLRVLEGTEAFVGPALLASAVAAILGVPAGAVIGYWPQSGAASALRAALVLVGSWPRLVFVVVAVALFTSLASDPAAFAELRVLVLGVLVGASAAPALAEGLGERVARFHREDFVEAARAHGVSEASILLRHILLANCRALLARQCTLVCAGFLLVETSLSYLGDYGVPPPRPSWGNVLAAARGQVVHLRRFVVDGVGAGDAWAVIGARLVHEGALLTLLVPTALIAGTYAALLRLARSLDEGQP